MNPQPEPIVGQILMFVFIAISFFAYFTTKPKNVPRNLDFFEIGYISEDLTPISPVVISTKQNKPKTKINKTKAKEELSPLQNECIQALISLGMKKSEAKNRMQKIFLSVKPASIEEFIVEAFKNEYNWSINGYST